jgi:hypothetical protein
VAATVTAEPANRSTVWGKILSTGHPNCRECVLGAVCTVPDTAAVLRFRLTAPLVSQLSVHGAQTVPLPARHSDAREPLARFCLGGPADLAPTPNPNSQYLRALRPCLDP